MSARGDAACFVLEATCWLCDCLWLLAAFLFLLRWIATIVRVFVHYDIFIS
jgi:hypothetical protein